MVRQGQLSECASEGMVAMYDEHGLTVTATATVTVTVT
jgi:hypothetical protein